MADNTRMKELATEVRSQAEVLEQNERVNAARFERMETMQQASESRFAEMSTSMEMMLKQMQALVVTHGNPNAGIHSPSLGNSYTPPLFHVRNIKLEFPRFNGKNVLDWIFKAEQFFGYYNTPDPGRLTIASVHLEHEVVCGSKWLRDLNHFNHGRISQELWNLILSPQFMIAPDLPCLNCNKQNQLMIITLNSLRYPIVFMD